MRTVLPLAKKSVKILNLAERGTNALPFGLCFQSKRYS